MNLEQIATAITVLDELSASFTMMPAGDTDAAKVGLALVEAQSILIEYAAYCKDGYSHDEALRLTSSRSHALLNRQVD
jgi:hypothetical protein